MKLSIVIVNYNTLPLLKRCINSLISNFQFSNFQKKIIVVDNGSTDGSKEYLEKLPRKSGEILDITPQKRGDIKRKISAEQISGEYNEPISNITIIENNRNLGFSKAVNQGIRKSEGEYVLLLNTDTEVLKNSIEKLIDFAENKDDAGIVVPQLLNTDRTVQPSCYKEPTIIGAIKKYWFGKKNAFGKYAPEENGLVEVDAAVAAVWLLPRRTIEKVGLFDEKYFMYFEDLDYCSRVRKAGLKIYYLPESKIIHLHGGSGEKLGNKPNKWLLESSKKYHGLIKYYLLTFVLWTGQKFQKLKK